MKFSIRDVLLVTVIVALAVGWWLDLRAQRAIADFRLSALRALEHLVRDGGHEVEYDGEMPVGMKMFMHIKDLPDSPAPAPIPPKE